ncbi:MAG: ribonuclease P protein component [Desulfuromonadaceae bacterium]|nr:ribonuclease P protein component [Desulfuromonadaceae bacterium]
MICEKPVLKDFLCSQRFPKTHRLLKRFEFLEVKRSGKKVRGRYLTLGLAKREDGLRRLGLVVNRKVGNAVVRNRLKRLAREFFRKHYGQLPPCMDMVLVFRKGAGELLDSSFFHKEISSMLADFKWV